MKASAIAKRFTDLFGESPSIFRAPGRVNLIGEHTDYNDGFVMPCAIDFFTRVAISPRPDRKLVIRSEQFPDQFEFDLDHLPLRRAGKWCDYVVGVAVVVQQLGHSLKGANLLVDGEVPVGAGLSSSAAIEVAAALALLSLNGEVLAPAALAKICQRSENTFIGARVGVMDPFVSCAAKAGHAVLLDCRSLDFELIPIPAHARMVVCNTMVKHEHATGEYNRRREECEEGVRILSKWYPDLQALRDVSEDQLSEHSADIPVEILSRCRHVVQENDRVQAAARRLRAADLCGFGQLMHESHRSLRDLYKVSCKELDLMVELAERLPGFYGGRMTGGGFGGSTINFVEAASAEAFANQISGRYEQASGVKPDIRICSAADGAGSEDNAHA